MRRLRPLWLFVLLAAPTAGDIGSCGQKPVELDPEAFFQEKRSVDCDHCNRCGFDSKACTEACADKGPIAFDVDCFPNVHDGEVCLRALRAAGCNEYAAYVADLAPTVPTECNFCPQTLNPGKTVAASATASTSSASSSASAGSGGAGGGFHP
jgi:hypothetical protein